VNGKAGQGSWGQDAFFRIGESSMAVSRAGLFDLSSLNLSTTPSRTQLPRRPLEPWTTAAAHEPANTLFTEQLRKGIGAPAAELIK
jgi:hypothetical protein